MNRRLVFLKWLPCFMFALLLLVDSSWCQEMRVQTPKLDKLKKKSSEGASRGVPRINSPILTGGVTETSVDSELKRYGISLAAGKDGMPMIPFRVEEVKPDSPALRAGIQKNDLIIAIKKKGRPVVCHHSARR